MGRYLEAARRLQHITHEEESAEFANLEALAALDINLAVGLSLKYYIFHLFKDELAVIFRLPKDALIKYFSLFCAGEETVLRDVSEHLGVFIFFSSLKGCILTFLTMNNFPPPVFREDYEQLVIELYQVLKSGFN